MANKTGTSGDDILDGGLLGDVLRGLAGDDILDGKGGVDTLFGGSGVDQLDGGAGRDFLVVGDGETAANEVYDGGSFDNTDTLVILQSAAPVNGTFEVDFSSSTMLSLEAIQFDSAVDVTASFASRSFGGTGFANSLGIIGGAADQDILIGMNGDTFLDISGWEFVNWDASDNVIITGGRNAETIVGSSSTDIINSGTGIDNVQAGGGDDVVILDRTQALDSYDGGSGIDVLRLLGASVELRGATLKNFELLQFDRGSLAVSQSMFLSAEQFGSSGLPSDLQIGFFSNAKHTIEISMDFDTTFDASTFLMVQAQVLPDDVFRIVGDDDAETITGSDIGDQILGAGGTDLLIGGAGDDELEGGAGDDFMFGGAGNDTYRVDSLGDIAAELLVGADPGGVDRVVSAVSHTLTGFIENLLLKGASEGTGNALGNEITGGDGANVLKGLGGDDILNGAGGADDLLGGAGADTFEFSFAFESTAGAGNRDIIRGFQAVDVIDVSGVDANTGLADNQAFVLDADGVLGAGEFRIRVVNGNTFIDFNTDADSTVEMQIELQKVSNVTAGDLIL